MATSRILYSYMHDPNDPKRVVTIGRQLVDAAPGKQIIKFAISVNNPGQRRFDYLTGEAYHIGPHDNFTKKKARMIVDGRLETEGCHWIVDYNKGEHPMDTIRTYIALNHGEFTKAVVRTSDFYTEMRAMDEQFATILGQLKDKSAKLLGTILGNTGDSVVEAV